MTGSLFSWLTGHAVKAALALVVSWADRGAADALRLTASLIGATTQPSLDNTWFSAAYWRVEALSGLLTIPFLFAACVHALVRSDLAMIGRAAFGYLPLAMLGVAIAAPLTSLLLSGTDEMCVFVSAASGHADTDFLGRAGIALRGASAVDPFVGFFAALITVAATLSLWLELLIRGAAVEVIVFLLPLFFAAMVWPARRLWVIRAIETLVALILSKFAIVAVLTLGGAAITHGTSGPSNLLIGAAIVLLTVFTPWALLRLLPLHEVAAAAAGGLSQPARDAVRPSRERATEDGRRAGGNDDQTAALRHLVAGVGALRDGRGMADGVSGDALTPTMQQGMRAISPPERPAGAGDGDAGAGPPAAGTPATAQSPAPDDLRGPVPEQFRPSASSQQPWTLGDGDGDQMGPFPVDEPSGEEPPRAPGGDSAPPLDRIADEPPPIDPGADEPTRLQPPPADPPAGDG